MRSIRLLPIVVVAISSPVAAQRAEVPHDSGASSLLVPHARARLLTKADTASHLWAVGTLVNVNNRTDCFAVRAPIDGPEGSGSRFYLLSGVHRLQISTRYDGMPDPETGKPRRYAPGADISGETWREVSPDLLAAQPADCMPAVIRPR